MSGTRTVWVMALLGALASGVSEVGAGDYFVSASGDDAHAGTSAQQPLRTIGAAVARAQAGDTIHIAPGRYSERVRMERSGTADAPITLRRDGEGEVVWTTPADGPQRFQDRYALNIEGQEHIAIEGITFQDCEGWIMLWESNHCVIRDCTFDGARMYNALRINSGSFNRILDSRFVRGRDMTGFREDADWIPIPGCDYIEIFRDSHNNLVQGNIFGEITHMAVSISAVDPEAYRPSRNIVRDNVFRDPFWKVLWLHAGEHNVFEDNLCLGRAANFVQLEAGSSIIRRNRFVGYRDSTDGQPDETLRGAVRMQFDFAQHNRIYNNLFYDNERTLTNNSFRGQVTDNIFQNNIFFANRQSVFLGFPDYTTRNRNHFFHNLILQQRPGQTVIQLARREALTLAQAQADLPELYAGNIELDPRLVLDDDGMPVGLEADAPCLDAGGDLTATVGQGEGTELVVQDARWFCDGNGLIAGDEVVIGQDQPAIRTRGGSVTATA